ncbi:MAG TPA: hypothetical protein P5181_02865 [Dermatophilaceae bacterium]|nr:hypothetical protein [Dermatophilaceae bacterium]
MSQPQAAAAPPPAQATAPPAAGRMVLAPAATAQPPGVAGSPTSQQSPATPRLRTFLRRQFQGTPGRMRVLGALAALAAVAFGILGGVSLASSAGSLDAAAANARQLVRVQAIYADLLRADADATNGFLVGGFEDAARRADYTDAMGRVTATIAEAAREQRADGTALAALNTKVAGYAALVEQARAYNRQGLPVGAQYMTSASASLRTDAVPILESLRQANTARAEAEFRGASSAPIMGWSGLGALVVFLLVALWLARRTHRYVNVGLTAAAATVLAALLAGMVTLGSIGAQTEQVRLNSFAGTVALTSARVAAFDAKANESLGLIRRGQAKSNEDLYAARSATVTAATTALSKVVWTGGDRTSAATLAAAWTAYDTAHKAVRAKDDGGDWDGAVALATTTDATGSSAAFAAFEQQSAEALSGFREQLDSRIGLPATMAKGTGLLILLAGLTAAGLAMRGIGKRVEEYR